MHTPYSQRFWKVVGLIAFSGALLIPQAHRAVADTMIRPPFPQPPPSPPPTPENAFRYLKIDATRRLCQSPLTLSVENATMDDIAAQVEKAIGELAPQSPAKIHIEVRDVLPIHLSFAAKASTVGEVLSSAAILAGAQLWMFGDHLLLAPQAALLPAEKEALARGFAVQLQSLSLPNSAIGLGPFGMEQRRAFSAFIADEMKGINTHAGTGGTPNASPPVADRTRTAVMGEINPATSLASSTLGQLSPESQAMIEELVSQITAQAAQNPAMHGGKFSVPDISPGKDDLVNLNSENGGAFQVHMTGPDGTTVFVGWSASGNSTQIGISHPLKKPSTPQVGIPLDPSAGKS